MLLPSKFLNFQVYVLVLAAFIGALTLRAAAKQPGTTFRDCPSCPEMVVVPAGSFRIGSDRRERRRRNDEGPIRPIQLRKPFAIGKFEITFAEWDACVADGGCSHRPADKGWGRERRPVINVSWSQIASQYLPWLSRKSGQAYRLPSEAEWEYAARAGTTSPYWWGSIAATGSANCKGCDERWGGSSTAPVGSYAANAFGIHDTAGNVFELLADCWNSSHKRVPNDGQARTDGNCKRRVIRGGSWYTRADWLRSAARSSDPIGYSNSNVGFRVARSLLPEGIVAKVGKETRKQRSPANGTASERRSTAIDAKNSRHTSTGKGNTTAAEISYWMHNGSLMRMRRSPAGTIEIWYERPHPQRARGIKAQDQFVAANEEQGGVGGYVRLRMKTCTPISYYVSGGFQGGSRNVLVLEGKVPSRIGCAKHGVVTVRNTRRKLVFSRTSSPADPTVVSKPDTYLTFQWKHAIREQNTRPNHRLAWCDVRRARLAAVAQKLSITLPNQGSIALGEWLELKWESAIKLPKGDDITLYFELPKHVEIAGSTSSTLLSESDSNPGRGRVSRIVAGADDTSLLNGRNNQPSGIIRIRPTRTGPFTISAGVITSSTSLLGGAEQSCLQATSRTIPPTTVRVQKPGARVTSGQGCYLGASLKQASSLVKISAPSSSRLRAGEAGHFKWRAAKPLKSDCRTALYLVFTTPEKVRFAGDGFFVLNPGAAGPFGLKHAIEQVRVFVPLHIGTVAHSGTLTVKPYQVGPFNVQWSLVEIPTTVSVPMKASDLNASSPVVLRENDGVSLDVQPGQPYIVIRDPVPPTKPVSTTLSADQQYRLHHYKSFVRVLDARTRELVLERDGVSAGFSPTGRYIHLLLEDRSAAEIIDLVSGERILRLDNNAGEAKSARIGRSIEAIAWGRSDSFVFVSPNSGNGLLLNTSTDRAPTDIEQSYKRSNWDNLSFRIDLESASIQSVTAYSLLELQLGDYTIVQPDGTMRAPKNNKYARSYPLFPLRSVEAARPIADWQLGADTKLSYYSGLDGGRASTSKQAKNTSRLLRQLLMSQKMPNKDEPVSDIRLASSTANGHRLTRGAMGARAAGYVKRNASELASSMLGLMLAQVTEHAQTGGALFRWAAGKAHALRKDWDKELERTLWDYVKSPHFVKIRSALGFEKAIKSLSDIYGGCDQASPHVGEIANPNRIIARKRWDRTGMRIWLLQQECVYGTGNLFGQVGVLVAPAGGVPYYLPITDDLGLNSQGFVKGWLTEDNMLLLAAPNRAILAYDVPGRQKLAYIQNAKESEIAAELHITTDKSKLLHISDSGRLFIYGLADQRRKLNGYFLDDELVIYRDDGYYHATPEGAAFVHLKFPGVTGYHSFQQFAATLNRPDIVESTLAGKENAPRPILDPPPTLDFSVTQSQRGPQRLASVEFTANSSVGLQRLIVFADGRPVKQVALKGNTAASTVSVPLPPEARWLAAVAVDAKGYESVAKEERLDNAKPPANSTLFAITFGTDEYRDRAFENLTGAGRDAEAIKSLLLKQTGKVYTKVHVGEPLDPQFLRQDLPERIRQVVSKASPGDTIIMFAAGHGEVGPDGNFYLATYDTKKDDLANTALAWDDIARAFDGVKARVVVFLDACRAGTTGLATNDRAVFALTSRSNAISVIAASKGRQQSKEEPDRGGGLFTNAIVAAATKDRSMTDHNENGVIELSELYGAIKGVVVRQTRGAQSPWIARNRMVGQVPLF